MTGKELRELARTVLAKELAADSVDPMRVNAAIQVLGAPMDPDEEREAHRLHIESMNAKAPFNIHAPTANFGMAGNAADFSTMQQERK